MFLFISQAESEKTQQFVLLIISWGLLTLTKQELNSDDPLEAKSSGHMNIIVEL
jgi:hypothetical protein